MSSRIEAQREMARIALSRTAEAGFALAGSGAIREHGVIDRPTEDIDLFTMTQDDDEFARAVDHVVADLRENGYEVEEALRVAQFARLKSSQLKGISSTSTWGWIGARTTQYSSISARC